MPSNSVWSQPLGGFIGLQLAFSYGEANCQVAQNGNREGARNLGHSLRQGDDVKRVKSPQRGSQNSLESDGREVLSGYL